MSIEWVVVNTRVPGNRLETILQGLPCGSGRRRAGKGVMVGEVRLDKKSGMGMEVDGAGKRARPGHARRVILWASFRALYRRSPPCVRTPSTKSLTPGRSVKMSENG